MRKSVRFLGVCLAAFVVLPACSGPQDVSANKDDTAEIDADWTASLADADRGHREMPGVLLDEGSVFMLGSLFDEPTKDPVFYTFDVDSGDISWQSETGVANAWVTSDFVVLEYLDALVEVRDRESGELRYDVEGDREVTDAVAVSEDAIFTVAQDGQNAELEARALKSGKREWSTTVDAEASVYAPVQAPDVHGYRLSVNESGLWRAQSPESVSVRVPDDDGTDYEYVAHAVDDGDKQWSVPAPASNISTPRLFMTMTSENRMLLMEPVRKDCSATYATVEEGASRPVEFDVQLTQACDNSLGAVFADDLIYARDDSGKPQVWDSNTGEVVWSADEAGLPVTLSDGVATYAVDGQDGSTIKSVDIDSGEALWTWKRKRVSAGKLDRFTGRVGMPEQHVFGNAMESYAVDSASGEELWRYPGVAAGFDEDHVVFITGFGELEGEKTLAVTSVR